MTVAELIAELKKHPGDLPVKLVYDSAVMVVDIKLVEQWYPEAYLVDIDKGDLCVGLFDAGSAREATSDPEDSRRATP